MQINNRASGKASYLKWMILAQNSIDGVKMDVEIKQMLETSFIDWDGKVVAVLYVPDCNFRCPFCHNWQLFEEPEKFDNIPFEKIEKYLTGRGYKDFIDGVCVTGGEPTLYSGLPKFLKKIKDLNMPVKLDTNGSNPKMLAKLDAIGSGEKSTFSAYEALVGPVPEL